jgi:hypothetical protein
MASSCWPWPAEILAHQPKLKPPEFTTKDFEQVFYALELEDFIQYTKLWNENSLKLKMPNYKDYDQWLNYFKTLSPNVLTQLAHSLVRTFCRPRRTAH